MAKTFEQQIASLLITLARFRICRMVADTRFCSRETAYCQSRSEFIVFIRRYRLTERIVTRCRLSPFYSATDNGGVYRPSRTCDGGNEVNDEQRPRQNRLRTNQEIDGSQQRRAGSTYRMMSDISTRKKIAI